MERHEDSIAEKAPLHSFRGCWPGQGFRATFRLAIRSIGRCTRRQPVGTYENNRSASTVSTRLVLHFLQPTFVVTGTTGLLLDGVFCNGMECIRKHAMPMLDMLISGSEVSKRTFS
jgi:hypothetical protein